MLRYAKWTVPNLEPEIWKANESPCKWQLSLDCLSDTAELSCGSLNKLIQQTRLAIGAHCEIGNET